ncbi:PD-(D/E)XK endonuclease-like domain-containing protein [Flavobacterium longum]|uniref:PD-(D/E)XK nuclease family protein n=1 Tax=Flavobacterium longum TaxID=1299340 RepID=UPI0039EAB810
MADTFLKELAARLFADYGSGIADLIVVLPSRRAKVFFVEAIKHEIEGNVFAPDIISIEDFVQEIAGISAIDNIALLFEFYQVYECVTDQSNRQSFEVFANWAKTLLQDFNEIDRYLISPPEKVLKYLEDIKELEHWSVGDEKTELIASYLEFWKLLPTYYHALYQHLLEKRLGYQGMIYREAVKGLHRYLGKENRIHVFAGFNALNAAEENIFQQLLSFAKATIYWDADSCFLDDPHHAAGLFLRRYKKNWAYYKKHPFDWTSGHFTKGKSIEIIGTPKSIGQAKIAGSIVANILKRTTDLSRTAIVLSEESLLLPLLHALPADTPALNITMGYSGKNNPAQILIAKLFKLHLNSLKRNANSYVMYYKDVLDVLTHPLVEPMLRAGNLVQTINRNNYTFIVSQRLFELYGLEDGYFDLLFKRWDMDAGGVLERLSAILLHIKHQLGNDNQQDKIAKAFLYAVFKTINQLRSYFAQQTVQNLDVLHTIYKQIIDFADVSFEGEPLEGLQIMGVLESRVLDFENVIVLSVNEGKFPAGKTQNSFIPYDVKRELGLPTFKEKDAIYTYHFYHLLQRSQNVYLLYNTESEGLDGGEKSRFITQLEIEQQPSHALSHRIYQAEVPSQAYQPAVVEKSETVVNRLKELAQTGFSPSSLTAYIRDPMTFYFQRILRISQTDEVEENIAVNTLGTIIHGALEALYLPFVGRFLTKQDLRDAMEKLDQEVLLQFKKIYREGEIKKGKNLLAFEVAKRHVQNFIKMEIAEFDQDPELAVKIIALEKRFERQLSHEILPYPVLIGGSVDRIEERNGRIRIVDYKTGKVEKRNIKLNTWNGLTDDIKNDKIIQVLAYAFMFAPHAAGRDIEVGIISFKNMRAGFLPFGFVEEKSETAIVTDQISSAYINELALLLREILDADIPFIEKT